MSSTRQTRSRRTQPKRTLAATVETRHAAAGPASVWLAGQDRRPPAPFPGAARRAFSRPGSRRRLGLGRTSDDRASNRRGDKAEETTALGRGSGGHCACSRRGPGLGPEPPPSGGGRSPVAVVGGWPADPPWEGMRSGGRRANRHEAAPEPAMVVGDRSRALRRHAAPVAPEGRPSVVLDPAPLGAAARHSAVAPRFRRRNGPRAGQPLGTFGPGPTARMPTRRGPPSAGGLAPSLGPMTRPDAPGRPARGRILPTASE